MQTDRGATMILYSDQELAVLVKDGDKDAFSVLCGRYGSVISGRAWRYCRVVRADVEDFVQEGLLALYRAAKGYRASGIAEFRTYAVRCVNNAMLAAIKKHQRHAERQSPHSLDSLDNIMAGGYGQESSRPEKLLMDSEAVEDFARQISSKLSRSEQQVLRLYLRGHSYRQISNIMSTSTKSVDNALQRVRRKLKG